MKNKILLIILIIFSITVNAQRKVGFGFKAGVTKANLKGEAVQNLNQLMDFASDYLSGGSATGFYTGAYMDIPMGKRISFQPGFFIAQKGYQMKAGLNIKPVSFLGVGAKAKLQLNYFEIPLLLKANLGRLNIFAGPQFSYLRNADLKVGAGALGINIISTRIPVTSQFNRWDASVTGGIGLKVSRNIDISAAYDYGLGRIDKSRSVDAYNRAFKVGIGFKF
ncbi:MAG: PorT family protein [Chitinophagaceae bacterium]|nr:PorT family protein [Bacteroidota bacterium]MCC6257640.1 PorT family protein [Chitinophagaceae bacterium]MCW5916949.1 PorT family protein [Ferruginibacter sp.]